MKKSERRHRDLLDAHMRRVVATEALCDPGTVSRYMTGGSVRGLSARRIASALKKLGFGEHVRREGETAAA